MRNPRFLSRGARVHSVDVTPGRRLPLPAVLTVAAVLWALPLAARGQGSMGMHWGIAGGGAFPYEDAKDVYTTGYQGALLFNVNAPIVGLRFEGMYARMNEESVPGQSGHVLVGGATANLVIGPKLIVFRPYLVGGGGFYRVKFFATRSAGEIENTQDKFGWNAGVGVSFGAGPAGAFFIEARYIQIQTDPNFALGSHFTFVPVTVGFVF
jgi:opacity protein-like surface antigen